jgi:uncharacterized protein YbjQ (UPF0145 family)
MRNDKALVRSASDGAVVGFRTAIPVTTTLELPGARIVQVVGIARGNTIRARHVGRDILATLRALVGGEITEYTKMVAESREQAMDRMVDAAIAMGADAVVGMRFETCSMMQGAAELLAYGTAVRIEK